MTKELPVKWLALDFDGVIADSLMECLVTAHNAYSKHIGSHDFRLDSTSFTAKHIKIFRQMRCYIRRGEDYVYLQQAIAENHSINSQSDFDDFSEANEDVRETYSGLFYGQREKLQTEHSDEWLALNRLYPAIETFLQRIDDPDSIFIVTTKDLMSVQLILAASGIELNSGHMYQATKTYRKPEILNQIIKTNSIMASQMCFVDDHAATVLEASEKTDLVCYFAAWGYHSKSQVASIVERNGQMLTLNGFIGRYNYLTVNGTPD